MTEPAWSALQRRIARMWGAEKTWRGEKGSDALRGRGCPVSLEVTRSKGLAIRRAKVEQAKRQSREEGLPWVLVVADHGDRNPVAVCDHRWLVQLAKDAGLLAPSVTHGRHCPCSACAREDWTNPRLGPCGMHGPECPPVYAPITERKAA